MNDRELLEKAAKAAGLSFHVSREWHDKGSILVNDSHWNPLEDDGDALRLAVKLGMCLGVVYRSTGDYSAAGKYGEVRQDHDRSDPYAATRRAIVRAAAAMGEA